MRCAVVINGIIDNFVEADPSVDTIPGALVIGVSDEIDYRYIWNGSAFIPNIEYQQELDDLIASAWA